MPFAINLVANVIFTPIQFGLRNLSLSSVNGLAIVSLADDFHRKGTNLQPALILMESHSIVPADCHSNDWSSR